MIDLDEAPVLWGEIVEKRRARKEHKCLGKPGCVIRPGDTYWDAIIPPWTRIQDDPEYPGVPNGEWTHQRTHIHGQHNDGKE